MRLAKDYFPGAMAAGDTMKEDLQAMITLMKPKMIIETGTYLGEGSTRSIIKAILNNTFEFSFHTIEANESFYKKAKENIKAWVPFTIFANITMWNGISIPAALLPSSIDDDYPEEVFTDHINSMDYLSETRSYHMENCLKAAIDKGGLPDLVLLDSAGHMGTIEFDHLMSLIPEGHSFILILDDTHHRKHYKTMLKIRDDSRFRVLKESKEKFGHAIIKFN